MKHLVTAGLVAVVLTASVTAQEKPTETPKPTSEVEQLRAVVARLTQENKQLREEGVSRKFQLGQALLEGAICEGRMMQAQGSPQPQPAPSEPAAPVKP